VIRIMIGSKQCVMVLFCAIFVTGATSFGTASRMLGMTLNARVRHSSVRTAIYFGPDDINSDESNGYVSIKDEVSSLLEHFVELDRAGDSSDMMRELSSKLTEHAHLFAKGDIYETVLQERATACSTEAETARVGRVDTLVRGFIQSERKARARLKVNYVLAGAASDRIDEAVTMLAEADEIDDDLFLCIDALIQKELANRLGPTASSGEEDIKNLTGVGKSTVEVLKMVQRRLRAEIQTMNQPQVKLLALLVHELDASKRDRMLRQHLKKVEEMEAFAVFVENAAEHLISNNGRRNDDAMDDDVIDVVPGNINIEVIKDVQRSLHEYMTGLQTGLKDGYDFSTSSDDYLESEG